MEPFYLVVAVTRLYICQNPKNCLGFPRGNSGKEHTCQCRRHKRCSFDPWVGKIPQRKAWKLTPVFLPAESHGQRSLVGYNPQGRKESVTSEVTQQVCTHANK